jgi:mRNA interferase MazF
LKRGEVWSAAGGPDYAGKPRPVVIVQDDAFGETDSITVCPLTTHRMEVELVRPTIEASAKNGLRETSFAMTDKITTMPRTRLGRRIGVLTPAAIQAVNRSILVFLGLAGPARG